MHQKMGSQGILVIWPHRIAAICAIQCVILLHIKLHATHGHTLNEFTYYITQFWTINSDNSSFNVCYQLIFTYIFKRFLFFYFVTFRIRQIIIANLIRLNLCNIIQQIYAITVGMLFLNKLITR